MADKAGEFENVAQGFSNLIRLPEERRGDGAMEYIAAANGLGKRISGYGRVGGIAFGTRKPRKGTKAAKEVHVLIITIDFEIGLFK